MILLKKYTKTFARADYAGLTEKEAAELRAKRSELAKSLKTAYNKNKAEVNKLRTILERKIGVRDLKRPKVQENLNNVISKVRNKLDTKLTESTNRAARKHKDKILERRNQTSDLINEVVNEGKNNKKTAGILKRAANWTKKNPKLAIGGTLGAAAIGTGGYLGYKYFKNKKSK